MESWRMSFGASSHGQGNADLLFLGAPSLMNMEETTKRGRFMMTEENMYDEDYFDYQLPEKKRRLTPEQVQLLEKSFEEENKLEPDRKSDLAKKLGLPPRQVAVWFQNRRARWKTKQLEKEFDQLKSAYDSLLTNYEFVLRENLNLKSQVVSLREKLEAQEVEAAVVRKHFGESLPGEAAVFTHATAGDEDGLSSGGAAVYDEGHQLPFQVNSEEDDGSDGYRSDLSNVIGPPEELESLIWCTWS